MKVLIDGKEIEVLNDVKVIWETTPDEGMELHMAATCEGIVLDRYSEDDIEATMSIDTEGLDGFCI
jgi:hypothetical protein|tara:strand:- start:302 stop:499 length:198 start_codon:yes stop_codon:yes gene_type:complete